MPSWPRSPAVAMADGGLTPARAARELLARRRARERLIDFTRYTKPDFEDAAHHRFIAEKLEAVERGECKRLMIFAPPRHTKSELASRRFPAWYIGRNPSRQLITCTYAAEFAQDFGREVRGIVSDEDYQRIFPGVTVAGDSAARGRWHTSDGGVYIAVGVGGPITGRGAHLALIDDPIKNRQDADSETIRDSVWKWYTSTLRTRLMPGGAIVLILTRWHEDDLAGRLLRAQEEGGEQWETVNLPAEAEAGDVMGRPLRAPLWPEWYPTEELERIKMAVGARDWSALYQQNPVPDTGGQFERGWFRWYDPDELPDSLNHYGASDYAVTEKGGDWTEHGVGGVDHDGRLWLRDWWSGQEAPDVTIEAKLDLAHQWRTLAWYGEKGVIEKAIGPATRRAMMDRQKAGKPSWTAMEYLASTTDKIARVASFRARAQAGAVYLPRGKRWAEELVEQLCAFPAGRHDDKVDVCGLFGRALDAMSDAAAAKAPKAPPPKPFTEEWHAARDAMDRADDASRDRYYR